MMHTYNLKRTGRLIAVVVNLLRFGLPALLILCGSLLHAQDSQLLSGEGSQLLSSVIPTEADDSKQTRISSDDSSSSVRIIAEIRDSGGNMIKGNVQKKGYKEMNEVLEFEHSIDIPVDLREGELQGIREHNPLTIVKTINQASPMLFKALTNGETLKTVTLHLVKTNKTGTEVEFFTYTLENAKIKEMYTFGSSPDTLQERVSFLYEKITVKYTDGNIESSDAWKEER